MPKTRYPAKIVKCPHCGTALYTPGFYRSWTTRDPERDPENFGASHQRAFVCQVATGDCPACKKFVLLLRKGTGKVVKSSSGRLSYDLKNMEQEEILFPKHSEVTVNPEVPGEYREEFVEASLTLSLSPKASAALSRRLLQRILRERFYITHRNLAQEIDEFIQRTDIPSDLASEVDAIRNVGNFALHPSKSTNTGEIVEVEPGEADWLLEVLETLFDFTFTQPKRRAKRKEKLNEKLKSIGKPPMKE